MTETAKPKNASKRQELREHLIKAVGTGIEPVPISPMYRLGILLIGSVMLLLPITYAILLLLLAHTVYWHAAYWFAYTRIQTPPTIWTLGQIVTWLVVGPAILLFMIKPLFYRDPKEAGTPQRIKESAEPFLFEYVAAICKSVGAPVPKSIRVSCDVNASAGLRRGFASLFNDDLTLTIGLPLVAGMTVRELTGVLAHEFGHFSQITGLRASFLTGHIHNWFWRAIYKRDAWDEWLQNSRATRKLWFRLFVYTAQAGIWISRQVLFVLTWLGSAISCLTLRQMEFDADRYEARMVGSDTFAKSTMRFQQLGLANDMAMNDLQRFSDESRLADSLPRLVVSNIQRITPEIRKGLRELHRARKTGLFDTHPSDSDRVKNAKREQADGVWQVPAEFENCSATVLFDDFDRMCRVSTLEFYQARLGNNFDKKRLTSTEILIRERDAELESRKALDRYFQVHLPYLQPLPLSENASEPPENPKESVQRVKQSREALLKSVPEYRALCHRLEKAESLMLRTGEALACLDCGLKISPREFDLKSAGRRYIQETHDRAREGVQHLAASLMEFELNASLRLSHALQLINVTGVSARMENSDEIREETRHLVPEAVFISGLMSELGTMRILFRRLTALFSQIEKNNKNQRLIVQIFEQLQKLHNRLHSVRYQMQDHDYPFNRDKVILTLTQFALPEIPDADELVGLLLVTRDLYQKLAGLQIRLFARLAHIAENVESILGLPPFPEPDFHKQKSNS